MAIIDQLYEGAFRGMLTDKLPMALIICLAFLVAAVAKRFRATLRLPPGPAGVPIFGIIPFIKEEFHLHLYNLSKEHGGLMSLKMGQETIVVISDHQLIKKAFQRRDMTARPKNELGKLLGGYGIINADGQLWKSQRRYLLNQKMGMRHWGGRGMEHVESLVKKEVVIMLMSLLQEDQSGGIDPAGVLNGAASNVICSMIMSRRFNYKDKRFKRFMHLFDEGFKLFTMTGAMVFVPFLRYLPGISDAVRKLKDNREEMVGFVRKVIDEHRSELDPSSPKDLIDSYLLEIESAKEARDEKDLFQGFEPEKQLEQVVLDLFSAGVETLKTSVLWSIIYMLHNPEVKRKVQGELDSVVGSNRLPSIQDYHRLPYTRATLYEILRRSSVVPMGTTHSTDRTVEFEGYEIPKNASVIPLLHAVHMNPDNWEKPEEFRPERFLREEGTKVVKPDHFMPFGTGQRMCLGDNLAEKEFFLFFASLMKVFDFQRPEGESLPSLRGVAGVTVTPKEFSVKFVPRPIKRDRASDRNNNVMSANETSQALFTVCAETLLELDEQKRKHHHDRS